MTVLVTGGTGFVGSALTELLLSLGYKIILVTRCSAKASRFAGNDNICTVEGLLADPSFTSGLFTKFKPQAVVHLAWEGVNRNARSFELRTKEPRFTIDGDIFESNGEPLQIRLGPTLRLALSA
jgi:nucleoside-diphosphate-sugar epimerase